MRVIALALVVVGALATRATAYPELQFSAGSDRCSACHFAPEGGGLVNDFGRTEASDTLSWGGDGRLLHGAWTPPAAIALGGDLRVATLGRAREQDEPLYAAFPMQADLYARVAAGPISLNVTGGYNGAVRGRDDDAGLGDYLVSREHYVMYQREPGEPYVRAGRFYPVLGLRTHDHTELARRALDFYNLDEPYALGGGAAGGEWELHVAGFVPNPTGAGVRAYGASAYYERFVGAGSIAGQTRVAISDADRRVLGGAVGKWWFAGPKLLVCAELDLQHQAFADADASRLQLLAYAGVTRVMLPGILVGIAAQHWTPDLGLGGSARDAAELDVQLFPWAHVELHLLGRLTAVGGSASDALAMLQLHYYL